MSRLIKRDEAGSEMSSRESVGAESTKTLPDAVIHTFAPIARLLEDCDSRIEFLQGEGGSAVTRLIMEAVEESTPKVLSFDVFDTFLLRNDKPEALRFFEWSQLARSRLGDSAKGISDIDLLLARALGMEVSYRARRAVEGCREGKIEEVVHTIRKSLNLSDAADLTLLQAEIDYEAANLTINPALLAAGRAFRANGGSVILVSDMYLGESQISNILRRMDLDLPIEFDAIYSSADHVVSKRSGKIFSKIQTELEREPGAFLHVGDAIYGDVFRCAEAGWHTIHFPSSRSETARRANELVRFCEEMAEREIDVTSWAKI
jgi:predicted HAD superfamily hydrolase